MARKKILYIITKGNWGGAQRYVFDLASSLPREEFEPVVACGSDGLLTERLRSVGIRTVLLPSLQRDVSLGKELKAVNELFRLFKKEKPDIVHLNSSKAALLGVLASRLVSMYSSLLHALHATRYTLHASQIVFTVHGWPFNEGRKSLWKGFVWCASYLTALLASETIVISSRDFRQAKAMPFIAANIHLIRNGIRTPDFLSREEARNRLGLSQNALIIGSVGELTRNKNYTGLLAAIGRMPQQHDFKLVIIGDGEERAELIEMTRSNPILKERVVLVGFKEHAAQYLKAFDVFVLYSRKEGLPYVLLESGATSLAVTAAAVGGIPDIVENDQTGLLAPPYALEEALRKLLAHKNLRDCLGRSLEEKVRRDFSFERMRLETLHIYRYLTP